VFDKEGHYVVRTGAENRVGVCGIFSALVYPLMMFVRQDPALAMMLSLYVTLDIFLLLAARNPSANRSLIAFAAWSSFAYAALMGAQAFLNLVSRGKLWGVAVLVIIGVALIALAPLQIAAYAQDPTCEGSEVEHQQPARCSNSEFGTA
jgi:hypothetical protein